MAIKPAPRTYSLQDYVEELTRRIYLMTEADPELRVKAAAILTSHVGGVAQDSPRGEPCGAKAPCGHPLTEDSRRLGKCWYCEAPLERGGERT